MTFEITFSALIERMRITLDRLYESDCGWKERGEWPDDVSGTILHGPASAKQIADLEKRLGNAFPPSYRSFLSHHNGWEHFWGDYTLIGATGAHTQRVLEKLNEYTQIQDDDMPVNAGKLVSAAEVDEWEARDECNFYLPKHVILGTNFGGECWFFDTRTRRNDGEMSVVHWTLDYGLWEDERFASFMEFLAMSNKLAEAALERSLEPPKSKSTKRKSRSKKPTKKRG